MNVPGIRRSPAFLLAGGPGVGKSTVSAALRDHGVRSIDLDFGYARWEDESGRPVEFPAEPRWPWLREYRWNWRLEQIDAELAADHGAGPLVLAGTARNMFDALDRFDRLLLLTMDDATREARLADPRRNNPFGRFGDTAEWSRWWHRLVESELVGRDAVIIDATAQLDTVVAEVRRRLIDPN